MTNMRHVTGTLGKRGFRHALLAQVEGITSQISELRPPMRPSSMSNNTAAAVKTLETDANMKVVSGVTLAEVLELDTLP